MSRPDVLVYIDWFSPGFKAGGPIRSMLNMAQQLAPFLRFNIITRDRDYLSDEAYSQIEINTWIEFQGEHRIIYLSPDRCTYKGLRKASQHVSYSKIYINGFLSPRFSILPLLVHRNERKKVIIAPRGMLRSSATALKPLKKTLFFLFSKLAGLHRGVSFHATDEREMEDIRSRFPNARISLSPNLSRPMTTYFPSEKKAGVMKLAFIGRVAPEKNFHYALEVLSKLVDGKVEFNTYGAVYDQEYGSLCEELSSKLPANVNHSHHEQIDTDEVIPLLQKHDLLLLPSKGENFGHVILESFMASRPVLISDQTPWKDLRAKGAGADFSLTDSASFHAYLTRVLRMGKEEHEILCQGAYSEAKSFCEDERLLAQAKALFLD
jgi:glycosyltransferase involved in cell wall biosynthesis